MGLWRTWWPLQNIPYFALVTHNYNPFDDAKNQIEKLLNIVQTAPSVQRDGIRNDIEWFMHANRFNQATKQNVRQALTLADIPVFDKPSHAFMGALSLFKDLPVSEQPVLSRTLPLEISARIMNINMMWRELAPKAAQLKLTDSTYTSDVAAKFKEKYTVLNQHGKNLPGQLFGLNLESIGRAYAHIFLLQTDLFQDIQSDDIVLALRNPENNPLFMVGNFWRGTKSAITLATALQYGIPLLGYTVTQNFSEPDEETQNVMAKLPGVVGVHHIGKNLLNLEAQLKKLCDENGIEVALLRPADMPNSDTSTQALQAYAKYLWHKIEAYIVAKPPCYDHASDDLSNIHAQFTRGDITDWWLNDQDFYKYLQSSNTVRVTEEVQRLVKAFPTISNHYFDPFHLVDMIKRVSVSVGGWERDFPLTEVPMRPDAMRKVAENLVRRCFQSFPLAKVPDNQKDLREAYELASKHFSEPNKDSYAYKDPYTYGYIILEKMSFDINPKAIKTLRLKEILKVAPTKTASALFDSLFFVSSQGANSDLRNALLAIIPRLEYWLQSRMNDGTDYYYVSPAGGVDSKTSKPIESFWMLDTRK